MGATESRRSTAGLVSDHRVILRVLDALERILEDADRTGNVPAGFLSKLVTFSRSFVDRCHHGKEERCLFPCLEQLGVPRDGGPIGTMLQEHEMGRALVARIADRLALYEGGAAPAADVLEPCRAYLDLLRQHIEKENTILFPMGDALLADQDDEQTLRCYEAHGGDPAEQDKLLGLAEEITAT